MSPKHHSDTGQGWIKRRFLKIEKQIREQAAARRMESATIGRGGLTIKDRGKLRVPYPTDLGTGDAVFIGPDPGFEAAGEKAFKVVVNAGDGVTPVMLALTIPPQPDYPAGFAQVALLGDFASLEATNTVFAWIPSTGDGMVAGVGETDLSSSGRVVLRGDAGGVQIIHATTGSAANCYIDPSNSRIWRSTSSRRNKVDIGDADIDPATVLAMRGVTFRDKSQVEREGDEAPTHAGFVAEELHDLGLDEFVLFDTDGEPEAIAYDRLSVALLAVLKDQERRIAALESAQH